LFDEILFEEKYALPKSEQERQ